MIVSFSCTKKKSVAKATIPFAKATPAELLSRTSTVVYPGVLNARKEAELSFQSAGKIKSINVTEGQKVRKNQLIASLDANSLQISKSQLAAIKIEQKNNESVYEKYKKLLDVGGVSQQTLDNMRTKIETVAETIKQMEEKVKASKSVSTITAPYDGVISQIFQKVSETTLPDVPVVFITKGVNSAPTDFDIETSVSMRYINYLSKGDPVRVTFSEIDQSVEGKIASLSNVPSPETNNFRVKVSLNNTPKGAVIGMFAQVRFSYTQADKKEELMVSNNAVFEIGNKHYVYRLKKNKNKLYSISKIPVTLKGMNDKGTLIEGGVAAGDLIVSAGVSNLTNVKEVRLFTK